MSSVQAILKINAWVASGDLSRTAAEALVQWLTEADFAAFGAEIRTLIEAGDTHELEDAFGKTIAFGTGGIRGRMGPGPNRFNSRTVGVAAQGLARYVSGAHEARVGETRVGEAHGIVLAWDTRYNSETFAKETARVLAANGVPVLIFDGYRSTPALSCTVRALGAAAGVMISASHNPPGDNGFKVYGFDGGQVVPPQDEAITREMRRVVKIRRIDYDEGVRLGLIRMVDRDMDRRYIGVLANLSLSDSRDVRVVYTPLHGVGMTSVAVAIAALGFRDVHYVAEQTEPDSAFSTLEEGIANPEKPEAFAMGIRKAAETGADLVLASDPDADRIGCALPLPERGWSAPPSLLTLNGHQIGVLLCHYILSRRRAAGTLPPNGLFCKTVVTSDLATVIARSHGLETVNDLPVGFKYIGAEIARMPPGMTFVFGTEESHGYLADARIRDKEAATGILLAEYAAVVKKDNRTLRDELDDIYRKHGYFRDIQRSVALPGADGMRRIGDIMAGLRASPPRQLAGQSVYCMIDRQRGQALDVRTGTATSVVGDRVNILIFTFSEIGHTRVIVRPSGTEPTIKCYVSAATVDMAGTRARTDCLAESLLTAMVDRCGSI